MFNLKSPSEVNGRQPPSHLPGERMNGNAAYMQLRDRVQQRLLAELSPSATRSDSAEVRQVVERIFNETLAEFGLPMSRLERSDIFEQLLADIMGLGPLEALLADDLVSEIMVNGPNTVYVERGGKLELSGVRFRDNEDVMRVVERIVAPLGRRIDESSPMVDARLPDGSRVNVIIPPLALNGPTISIRKFPKHALTPDELIKKGAMTPGIADFLSGCVKAALNIVVSGGTGTGKTTVLNALSSFIPEGDRILTIEDAAELRLQQPHG
ncbi:MAG: ATPase, T2SS/T4P/T4SS family [Caldilinea sp.]